MRGHDHEPGSVETWLFLPLDALHRLGGRVLDGMVQHARHHRDPEQLPPETATIIPVLQSNEENQHET